MVVSLTNAGKRFNRDWIFRHLNHSFKPGEHTAILGSNGSGKSTLLKCLLGYSVLSEGEINFSDANQIEIPLEKAAIKSSICAPYLDLYNEFTLDEIVKFQSHFKSFRPGIKASDIAGICGLEKHHNKPIGNYSSGMKQRVKLALSILSNSALLLLDEPTSNLDQASVGWFKELLLQNISNRTVVVASNRLKDEYDFCNISIEMSTFKKS